jgi:hypothetical protein
LMVPANFVFDNQPHTRLHSYIHREPAWSKNKMRYCTSRTTYGGTNRSPEEYSGEKQDESKDTFAFGNNIYTMVSSIMTKDLDSRRGVCCELCLR